MCQPLEERRAPATLADAKFSLPFLVSIAIVRRGMSVSDFSEAGLNVAEVLGIGSRISLIRDPALDWKLELPLDALKSSRVTAAVGLRKAGMCQAMPTIRWAGPTSARSFGNADRLRVTPVPNNVLARAENLARRLETLSDATELIRSLS